MRRKAERLSVVEYREVVVAHSNVGFVVLASDVILQRLIEGLVEIAALHAGSCGWGARATGALSNVGGYADADATIPHSLGDRASVLIAEWTYMLSMTPADASSAHLAYLAGWDGVLLVAEPAVSGDVTMLLNSELAPRVGIVAPAEIASARFAVELVRVGAAAMRLPPLRLPATQQVAHGFQALPQKWQPWLWAALRAPEKWNVKRLCNACGVDRRTLERAFRRAGLRSPRIVLSRR
ncbi:MAG: AraC family transcriptional regulator [Gemmatimonadaceae bacterium]|jgi:hypothetical protein|nr:AraC family transcriptional regulator [Gemmatimonadaceae bacterium]